jgi:4-oxalocrotonate tautomerase
LLTRLASTLSTSQIAIAEGGAMPLVNVRVIEGVFTPAQKEEMISGITEAMVAVEGESLRGVTWVLVEEVRSGSWGIGGKSLSTSDIQGLQGERVAASASA